MPVSHAMPFHLPRTARVCVAALFAAVALACALVPAAQAAESTTRSFHGVNYTLPADWEVVDVPAEAASQVPGDMVIYGKDDGVFAAVTIEDPSIASTAPDELTSFAKMLESGALYASETPAWLQQLAGSFTFTSGDVQGYPMIEASTTDFTLNGVTYKIDLAFVIVDNSELSGGVLMMSLLPATGKTTDNLAQTFSELATAQRIEVGGVSYEIPAGTKLVEGSIFGIGFAVATLGDNNEFLTFSLPLPEELAGVTANDFQTLADELLSSLDNNQKAAQYFSNLWAGGVDYLGFPSLALEFVLNGEAAGTEDLYIASIATVTPETVTVFFAGETLDATFIEEILESAQATAEPALAAVVQETAETPAADPNAPGFTVGV